jgi:hypothetical protein
MDLLLVRLYKVCEGLHSQDFYDPSFARDQTLVPTRLEFKDRLLTFFLQAIGETYFKGALKTPREHPFNSPGPIHWQLFYIPPFFTY